MPGDVLHLEVMEYSDQSGSKSRFVVVLFDPGDYEIVVAPGTTVQARTEYDIGIVNWQHAGFAGPTWVRADRPQTVAKNIVSNKQRRGHLKDGDWKDVREAFHRAAARAK